MPGRAKTVFATSRRPAPHGGALRPVRKFRGGVMDLDEAAKAFREFVAVVKALRTPGTGCPWDLEQTHASLRPYLVEETYEVLDALDRGDDGAFRDELGDLLLQVVLHAQL